MKKLIFVLAFVMISLGASTTAYAGSLNANEQAVLSVAGATFSYQGADYKLDPAYIDQLQQYLMRDDINLSDDQRNKVLNAVSGYIEQGVKEGYLKPVNGSGSTDSGSGDSTSGSGSAGSGSTGSDSSDSSTKDNDSGKSGTVTVTVAPSNTNKGTDSTGNNTTDNSKDDNSGISITVPGSQYHGDISGYIGSITGLENAITGSEQKNNQDTSDDSIDEIVLDLVGRSSSKNSSESDKTVTDNKTISNESDEQLIEESAKDMENEFTEESIIKDTGFDLGPTFVVIALMGVLMLAGIIVTIHNQYFAKSDE